MTHLYAIRRKSDGLFHVPNKAPAWVPEPARAGFYKTREKAGRLALAFPVECEAVPLWVMPQEGHRGTLHQAIEECLTYDRPRSASDMATDVIELLGNWPLEEG